MAERRRKQTRAKQKIVSLQKSLRFKPLRQSTNLVNKLHFHNKSCRLCCFPALGVFLKAPPPSPPQESFFFFRSSKLKTAQKRLSSRNQLISRNATHTSPPPALSLEGILSSFGLSEDQSITQAGNIKTHCSYPVRKIDLLIGSFFDGRPKQPRKKGPFSASDVCSCCLEACVVKRASAGHWSSGWCSPPGQRRGGSGGGGRHGGPGNPPPPPCRRRRHPLSPLSTGAEQRRAFTAEKPQRRRRLIRVKQAIESGSERKFFIPP